MKWHLTTSSVISQSCSLFIKQTFGLHIKTMMGENNLDQSLTDHLLLFIQMLPSIFSFSRYNHHFNSRLEFNVTGALLSQNHRMVWVGRDLKDHLIPAPCHEQGHLPLHQVAQSPIQPGLGHCQGGGRHSFSGQPVPVPQHTHHKKFLLYN